MRGTRSLLQLAVALCSAVSLLCQEPSKQPSPQEQGEVPIFRTGTRLVEVSVTVTDKQGRPLTNLTKTDFEIRDKGKLRDVAFFRYEGAPQPANTKSLPPGFFTNRTEALSGRTRNVAAIVLDSLNTQPLDKVRVRAQVIRYLRALAPDTRVAVFHMGAKLQIVHDFTDDSESLRERLEKSAVGMPLRHETDIQQSILEAERILNNLAGDPSTQEMMRRLLEAQIESDQVANSYAMRARIEATLSSMDALGRHLMGIPGRKSMIWISGGISMLSITGAMGFGPQGNIMSFEDRVKATSRRLAQQGIVMYIVDARGLNADPTSDASSGAPMPVRGRGRFERQMDANRISTDNTSAMNTMAEITGGRFFNNTNDLLEGFRHALSDLQGAYTLGFYASEEPDNKWRQIKVKVNQPGAKARYREGYISEPAAPQPQGWNAETWKAAISNPLGSSSVHLTARCEPLAGGDPGMLDLTVWVDPAMIYVDETGGRFKGGIEINVSDRTAGGTATPHFENGKFDLDAKQMAVIREQGISYRRQWKPAPDATSIRVIVRDVSTGQFGTLDLPMKQILASAETRTQ